MAHMRPLSRSGLLRGLQAILSIISGDGKKSRDLCYTATTLQANLRGTTAQQADAGHQICNVAVGDRTELVRPFKEIRYLLAESSPERND